MYVLSVIGVWILISCISWVITYLRFGNNVQDIMEDFLGEEFDLNKDQIDTALKIESNNERE